MAYIPSSGSVVAFQSNPSVLQTLSFSPDTTATGNITNTQSVTINTNGQSSVGIDVSGTWAGILNVEATADGSTWRLTTLVDLQTGLLASAITTNQSAQANVGGLQGFRIRGNTVTSGTAVITLRAGIGVSTVMLDNALPPGNNIIGGVTISQAASVVQQGTWISSVVSTVPSSVLVGASIFGQLPAGTAPLGSVATLQGTNPWIITGSVQATVNTGNSSVQLLAGSAAIGSVATLQGTVPWIISSVYGNVSGSVVAFQGTSPWVTNWQNSSIIAIAAGSVVSIPTGSVITVLQSSSLFAVQAGTRITSVAGGYATGAASVVSGLGIQVLGLRNDNLASIYGADAQYSPFTVGPVGEQMVANAPINDWVQSTGSCFTGVFQPITASVSGKYIYVTAIQIANASANNAYIAFSGAGIGSTVGSLIGYTIAPANGGSNIYFPNGLKSGISNPIQASINAVASVYLSAQGFISKV